MGLKYGIDVQTPGRVAGTHDWTPIMQNTLTRRLWEHAHGCVAFEAQLRQQGHQTRLVEIQDDDPTYSV